MNGLPASTGGGNGDSAKAARTEVKTITLPLRTIRRGNKACQHCKHAKVRCEGGNPDANQPCRRCIENGVSCTVTTDRQPTFSERLAVVEEQISTCSTHSRSLKTLAACVARLASQTGAELPEEINALLEDDESSDLAVVSGSFLLDEGRRRRRRQSSPSTSHSPTLPAKKICTRSDEALLETAAEVFLQRCAPYLPYIDLSISPSGLLEQARQTSALLYHAILASGSREAEELHDVRVQSHKQLLDLVRLTHFGPATFHDLQGLLIYIQFLTDAKMTGNAVDIAWSLDLHLAGHRLDASLQTIFDLDNTLRRAQEVRVLGCLFIVERRAAILAGRPSLFGNQLNIAQHLSRVTTLAIATDQDRRMLMCAELLSFTYEYAQDYTVDSARPIDEPDLALLRDASIRLNGWHHRWMGWANNVPDRPGLFTMKSSLEINYHFARFHLYCHYVRGIRDIRDTSPSHFEVIRSSVEYALSALQTAIEHFRPPVINYATRVLCTTVSFACFFSLKMADLHPSLCDPPTVVDTARRIEELFRHYSDQRFANAISTALGVSDRKSQSTGMTSQEYGTASGAVDHPDIFSQYDFSETLRFLSANDSVDFVGAGGRPQSIPDDLFLCPEMYGFPNGALDELMRL